MSSFNEIIEYVKDDLIIVKKNIEELSEKESYKLSFGTGYKWRKGQSNLMLANKTYNVAPKNSVITSIIKPKKKPSKPKEAPNQLEEKIKKTKSEFFPVSELSFS